MEPPRQTTRAVNYARVSRLQYFNDAGDKLGSASDSIWYDTTSPTVDLADPANGSLIEQATLNSRGYIDVTFSDGGGIGLDVASIVDSGQEFTLSGTAASGVTVNRAPTLVPGTTSTYRYTFSGSFGTGSVSVSFAGGSFADNAGNANTAATETFSIPSLSLVVNPTVFPENAGSNAATATVTRQGPTTADLIVNLNSSDTNEPTVQPTVTIPAGQISATFAVGAVDDSEYSGTRGITITASAPNYAPGIANIQVTDDELPSLTASVNPTTFAENGGSNAATGTITRQGPTTSALDVNLTSSDTTQAAVMVPPTVKIRKRETRA